MCRVFSLHGLFCLSLLSCLPFSPSASSAVKVSSTQQLSRTCSAALLASRQIRRRPRAVRMCGPLSTRIHHAFRHHVMCLFDTWLSSFACTEFKSSSTPFSLVVLFTSFSYLPWASTLHSCSLSALVPPLGSHFSSLLSFLTFLFHSAHFSSLLPLLSSLLCALLCPLICSLVCSPPLLTRLLSPLLTPHLRSPHFFHSRLLHSTLLLSLLLRSPLLLTRLDVTASSLLLSCPLCSPRSSCSCSSLSSLHISPHPLPLPFHTSHLSPLAPAASSFPARALSALFFQSS